MVIPMQVLFTSRRLGRVLLLKLRTDTSPPSVLLTHSAESNLFSVISKSNGLFMENVTQPILSKINRKSLWHLQSLLSDECVPR